MKKNLNDYREEMKALETRHHSLDKTASSEINHVSLRKEARSVRAPSTAKGVRLIPVLLVVVMAIMTLLFLVISEALKKH